MIAGGLEPRTGFEPVAFAFLRRVTKATLLAGMGYLPG